jgi:hypothetical protein
MISMEVCRHPAVHLLPASRQTASWCPSRLTRGTVLRPWAKRVTTHTAVAGEEDNLVRVVVWTAFTDMGWAESMVGGEM